MAFAAEVVRGTTRGLSRGPDYEYFCDSVADVYVGVRPQPPEEGPFVADFALFGLGDSALGYLATPPVEGVRDRRSIARVPDDAIFVNFSLRPWGLTQRGRTRSAGARSARLIDNAREFAVHVDPHSPLRLYTLRIPRDVLSVTAVQRIGELNDILDSDRLGAHVATQMGLLIEATRSGLAETAAAMVGATVELIEAAARGHLQPATRFELCQALGRARFADPAFDIHVAAAALGCSPRAVQAAFADRGERFSDWLRDVRLDHAFGLMATEGPRQSLGAIAARSGFSDLTTFHRAFVRRYGVTPGSARLT